MIPKIIFIDDDENILDSYKRRYRKMNKVWNMEYETSSLKALELVRTNYYDIAVIDIAMPHLNGIELLFNIKKDDFGTDVIIITGLKDDHLRELSEDIGAIDFIVKPIKSGELKFRIERVLQNRIRKYSELNDITNNEKFLQKKSIKTSKDLLDSNRFNKYIILSEIFNMVELLKQKKGDFLKLEAMLGMIMILNKDRDYYTQIDFDSMLQHLSAISFFKFRKGKLRQGLISYEIINFILETIFLKPQNEYIIKIHEIDCNIYLVIEPAEIFIERKFLNDLFNIDSDTIRLIESNDKIVKFAYSLAKDFLCKQN